MELEEILKEFDKEISVPKVVESFRDKTCFVCGQRFDKSSQVIKIRDFITQSYEVGKKDGMEGKVFTKIRITEEANIPQKLHDKIFQAGRQSMKEEILETLQDTIKHTDNIEMKTFLYTNQVEDIIKSI